ncbi:hypothetical protein A4X09_0g5548 [Tilletia walkeri]|uniref:Uncharacterized protein n=1 Tax=Tilletia walkeri TaxID=117179 RepID=A0A8X7T3I0_9BASI|nr:hypothetical protein A4X09_0g5548 [Tilletia walkeri]
MASRRRLQDEDIRAFFECLASRNITCSTLLRNLLDMKASRYSHQTRRLLAVHVKPFIKSHAALELVNKSKGGKNIALQAVVDQLQREERKAATVAEVSRPSTMKRADDVLTFRFAQTMRTIEQQMSFTQAVVNAIASSDEDLNGEDIGAGPSAIAEALPDLPPSAPDEDRTLVDDDEAPATAKEQMQEAWEDEGEDGYDDSDVLQGHQEDGEKGDESTKETTIRKR